MEIREARTSDADEIATTAADSLEASYGHVFEAETIDEVVADWYAEDRVAELLDDEASAWLVAEDGGEVVGFVQGALLDASPPVGEIDWLHVAPDARESGLARQLLGQIQETFEKRGAGTIQGDVLAENEEGWSFYENYGFDRVDEREVTIADETFTEYVYEHSIGDSADDAVVERIDSSEGELFVNYGEGERGSTAPFYASYRSRDLSDRFGWYCSNCESIATAMDSMGHIECNDCGNRRKATRWDASYL
ncbi:GNAT family N-acetyltransferase [Halosimplex salinum]|uniref:GNAT family N-acetyltransferase n=1 Tax=Halosimplex salinum TaxID=1710538 RepID=UPI000F481829|nr:GNAT family N-acetyltransferase [Halosimplex salinum]